MYLLPFLWSLKFPVETFVVISIWFLDLKAWAKEGFSWGLGPANWKNTFPTAGWLWSKISHEAFPAATISVDINLGASFDISKILYLASSIIASFLSCFFFKIK